jgi:hypothetical protein
MFLDPDQVDQVDESKIPGYRPEVTGIVGQGQIPSLEAAINVRGVRYSTENSNRFVHSFTSVWHRPCCV